MNETNQNDTYLRLSERYASGEVPWDDELPPPEVMNSVAELAPGKAIDLGCGYGRTAIFLAKLGWEVDAVDFIPQAIDEARRRAQQLGADIRFHVANVLELNFLKTTYDFGVDVGCCHNMTENELKLYVQQLARLIHPGALFLLFARLRQAEFSNNTSSPVGLNEEKILSVFANCFELVWSTHGETKIPDSTPWPSAWFMFRKR